MLLIGLLTHELIIEHKELVLYFSLALLAIQLTLFFAVFKGNPIIKEIETQFKQRKEYYVEAAFKEMKERGNRSTIASDLSLKLSALESVEGIFIRPVYYYSSFICYFLTSLFIILLPPSFVFLLIITFWVAVYCTIISAFLLFIGNKIEFDG